MLRNFWRELRSLLRSKQMERDMDRELRFHIDMEIEKNTRQGMRREEARRRALVSFGGVEQVKEACRDTQKARLIEALWQDARYGARILIRNPGFTVVAVITLALGIGAYTAIFSMIYGVLLRPLPYQSGDQLVVLRQRAALAGDISTGFSVKEIEDYRQQNQTLSELVEYHSMGFILYGGAEPERIRTGVVSARFFDLMGVKPLLGRTFLPDDEKHGAEAVLILSYDYWQRSHHGDPDIIGRVFRMNDRPHTVVGVLPPVPQYPNENDAYMPTSACPTRSSEQFIADRNSRMMSVFGRLKPEATSEQAQSDLGAITNRLAQEYPGSYPASRGFHSTVDRLRDELTKKAQPTFLILLGATALVLLIACFNVANLMLSRLMRREREMALRASLGAHRGRLLRQLLTEGALLALAGGGLGIVLASAGLNLLKNFAARFTPRAPEITIDGSVLIFTVIISLVTGLAFGLMPVLSATSNLAGGLKEASAQSMGASRRRLGAMLVVGQVAVSFALLIGAGLMLRSFVNLQKVNPGFDPEKVLAMRINLNWSKLDTNQQILAAYRRVEDRIKTQPGVISASISNNFPLSKQGILNGPFNRDLQIEGQVLAPGEKPPRADLRFVSTDFFSTIRLPLTAGRLFSEADNERAPAVAIISASLARQRWGNDDPIGRRVNFDGGNGHNAENPWITIVGVVGDVKQYGLESDRSDAIYRPLAQGGFANYLLARTVVDPMQMSAQIRTAVRDVDSEAAIDETTTLEEARSESLASPRLTMILIGVFAVIALVITAAGIAGVMALSVSQRTHELGMRMALGAPPSGILWMVLRQGMASAALGLALGTIGALALTRALQTFLFAIEPTDPLTFFAVALVLGLTAAIACLVPARRVTGIDPMIALRTE